MIKEVIVVEGKEDTAAISRAVAADTIETGGSAINNEILDRIRLALDRRGVIILTDPDHAGERLRRIIMERVPGCKHAFVPREKAAKKGEIGVEHCSVDVIRTALADVQTVAEQMIGEITNQDMIKMGLTHHPEAAARRKYMGRKLKIGYCNAKQFLKRCQMFAITKIEFEQAYQAMLCEKDASGRTR